MLVSGSSAISTAAANLDWLQEYSTELSSTTGDENTQKVLGIVNEQLSQWKSLISNFKDILLRAEIQYHYMDVNGDFDNVLGVFPNLYPLNRDYILTNYSLLETVYQSYTENTLCGDDVSSFNANNLEGERRKYGLKSQFMMMVLNAYKSSNRDISTFIASASFNSLYSNLSGLSQYGDASTQESLNELKNELNEIYQAFTLNPFTMENETEAANFNAFADQYSGGKDFFLQFQYQRWIDERGGALIAQDDGFLIENGDRNTGLLTDDSTDGNGSPLYQYFLYQDGSGNVLIDGYYGINNDPYLMTEAEYNLEVMKIQKAFLEDRLERSRRVYEYAYNEASRLSKEEQEALLQQTRDDYAARKAEYEEALAKLSGEIGDALDNAKNNMTSARETLANARSAFEVAKASYQEITEKLFLLSNPEARYIAEKSLNEAAQELINLNNKIESTERKYLEKSKEYYSSLVIQERSDDTIAYADRIEKAILILYGDSANGDTGYKAACEKIKQIIETEDLNNLVSGSGLVAAIEANRDAIFKEIDLDVLGGNSAYMTDAVESIAGSETAYDLAKNQYLNLKSYIDSGNSDNYKVILIDNIKSFGLYSELSEGTVSGAFDIITSGADDPDTNGIIAFVKKIIGDGGTHVDDILSNDTIPDKRALLEVLFYKGIAKIYPGSNSDSIDGFGDDQFENFKSYVMDLGSKRLPSLKIQFQTAIISVYDSIQRASRLSEEIFKYLIEDLAAARKAGTLDDSEYTIENISKRYTEANVLYGNNVHNANANVAQKVQEIIATVNYNTPKLYDTVLAAAILKIETASDIDDRVLYMSAYTYLEGVKDLFNSIESTTEEPQRKTAFENFTASITDLLKAYDYIKELYQAILTEKSDEDKEKILGDYTDILSTGKMPEFDAEGNLLKEGDGSIIFTAQDITDEYSKKLSILITEMINPGSLMFFNVNSIVRNDSIENYTLAMLLSYATDKYDESIEKRERFKSMSVYEIVGEVLGFAESERESLIDDIEEGSLSYENLKIYGRTLMEYTQGKEFEELPEAIKAAITGAASQFNNMLAARALVDNQNRNLADVTAEKDGKTELAEKISEIIGEYNKLAAVKENLNNGSLDFSKGLDDTISLLEKLNTQYDEAQAMVNALTMGEDFSFPLMSAFTELQDLKKEYDLMDYTCRYLMNADLYSSVDDYYAKMIADKDSGGFELDIVFAENIRTEIKKIEVKKDAVRAIENELPTDLAAFREEKRNAVESGLLTDDELDTIFNDIVGQVYIDEMYARLNDIDTFNALQLDGDYREYAYTVHFREYLRRAIDGSRRSDASFAAFSEIYGYLDADSNFQSGEFTSLPQYLAGNSILTDKIEDMKDLYYNELVQDFQYYGLLTDEEYSDYHGNSNLYRYMKHFISFIERDGNAGDTFDMLFGGYDMENNFIASGFSALGQYSVINVDTGLNSDLEFFKANINIFKKLYAGWQSKNEIFLDSLLPEDMMVNNIKREFFNMNILGTAYGEDFMEMDDLMARYGYTLEGSTELSPHKAELLEYENVLRLACSFNSEGQETVEEYISRNNVTDTKEQNFLRLFSIDPSLVSIDYLKDYTGIAELQLAGYLLNARAESMFSDVLNNSEDSIIVKLNTLANKVAEDVWLLGEVGQFLTTGKEYYTNYRDFIVKAKDTYETSLVPNSDDGLTHFEQMIVDDENLLSNTTDYDFKKDSDTDLTYNDEDGDDTKDANEKTLKEIAQSKAVEYRNMGKDLEIIWKTYDENNIDAILSDALTSDAISYYGDSLINNLAEEMSEFNKSLLQVIIASESTLTETALLKIVKEEKAEPEEDIYWNFYAAGDFGDHGLYDSGRLLAELNSAFEDINSGGTTDLNDIKSLLSIVTGSQNVNSNYTEMLNNALSALSMISSQIREAKNSIKQTGGYLNVDSLDDYLDGEDYKIKKLDYDNKKSAFENAESAYNARQEDYRLAQTDYVNQLEVISILFEKLDDARKNMEAEEAVYEYAATSYLYDSEHNADGGNTDMDGLKSDAREQYEEVKALHDQLTADIEVQKNLVEEVRNQNEWDDAQYKALVAELKEKADRAYRIEKLQVLMNQEIEQRALAYADAKQKYEDERNSFLEAKDTGQEEERNRILDKMMDGGYVNSSGFGFDIQAAALWYYNSKYRDFGHSDEPFKNGYIYQGFEWVIQQYGIDFSIYDWTKGRTSIFTEYLDYKLDNGNEGKNVGNSNIDGYIDKYLAAHNTMHIYIDLNFTYLGTYQVYKGFKKVYDKIRRKKVWGVPVGKWLAKIYYYSSGMWLVDLTLKSLFWPIRNQESHMKAHFAASSDHYGDLKTSLKKLQELKLDMLKKQTALAELTQLESLDDENTSGTLSYYDPKYSRTITKKKMTVKEAFNSIAQKNNIELKESDLDYLVSGTGDEENLNIDDLTEIVQTYDEKGYAVDEEKRFYNTGTVSSSYANHLESRRSDVLARYLQHTENMTVDSYGGYEKGYDNVVMDRAREQILFELYASRKDDNFDSASENGRGYQGYLRSMAEYFAVIEGASIQDINNLNSLIANGDIEGLNQSFTQIVENYSGLNDRELEQRRDLQLEKWDMQLAELEAKKIDWDKKVGQIFDRGARQWMNMEESFKQRWKDWRRQTEENIIAGKDAWGEKWSRLKDKKQEWLESISGDMNEALMASKLSEISQLVNGMIKSMNDQYGNILVEVDVQTILDEILADSPDLIPQELFDEIENLDVNFAITTLSSRSFDREIFSAYDDLTVRFEDEMRKTQNLQLIQAMTRMLTTFEERINDMNKNATEGAEGYAEGHNYIVKPGVYTRTPGHTDINANDITQNVMAFRNFKFNRNMIIDDKEFDTVLNNQQNMENWEFDAFMKNIMKQMEINFERLLDKNSNSNESIVAHIGEFPEYKDGDEPKLKNKGSGEYGRIGMAIYNDNKDIETYATISMVNKIAVQVVATYFGGPAAAFWFSVMNSAEQLSQRQINLQQFGFSVAKGAVMSYAGGIENSLMRLGATIAVSGVKLDDGGLNYEITHQDLISAGFTFAGQELGSFIDGNSMALNPNLKFVSQGMTAMAQSGFQYNKDGSFKGFNFGLDNVAYGMASGVAGYLGNQLGFNDPSRGYAERGLLGKSGTGLIRESLMMMYNQGAHGDYNRDRVRLGGLTYNFDDYAGDYVTGKMQEYDELMRRAAKGDAEAAKKMDNIDDLIGLAWLGMRKGESLLNDAAGSIAEFFKSIPEWFSGNDALEADSEEYKRIEKYLNQKWKEVDEFYDKKDKEYIKNLIKKNRMTTNVRDDRGQYTASYDTGSEIGQERLAYYANLVETNGSDLNSELDNREFIIIAQEGKGVGAITDGANESYNDRITVIMKDKDGKIIIDEFYRTSIDTGKVAVKGRTYNVQKNGSKNVIVGGHRRQVYQNQVQNSVASGTYDVLLANHGQGGKEIFGFNVFDFESNLNDLTPAKRKILLEKYNNGTLTKSDIRKYHLDRLTSVNLDGTLVSRGQSKINIHLGYNGYFGNLGCFVINNKDIELLENRFNNKYGRNKFGSSEAGKQGKLFLYQ